MIQKELRIKEKRIVNLLQCKYLSGILLSTQTNFLWFTGGRRNDVIKNDDISLVYLFITKDKKYLVTCNSDIDRVMNEELYDLGFEPILYQWYSQSVFDAVKRISPKGKIGADFAADSIEYIEGDMISLRMNSAD